MKHPRYFLFLLLFGFLLSCDKKNEEVEVPATSDLFKNSQLPVVKINTLGNVIQNEPKVAATYEIVRSDSVLHSGKLGIEYRGSTSYRLFDKKSYGIELRDEQGKGINVALLGMPAEEDWVLYGPYADKTMLRNVVIYELSNRMGQYASRTQYVDLLINDAYYGVYVLMERIKRDKNRVNIKKLEAADVDATSVSGGYILKIDKAGGDSPDETWDGDADYRESYSFRSRFDTFGKELSQPPYGSKQSQETYFIYHYPKPEDMQSEQKTYIQNYVNAFEEALLKDDFSTIARTYPDYIDVESFADFFILNELSANPDAYRLSTYLHKDRNGKLKMGPIWDFNIAFGMDERSLVNQWIYEYNTHYPSDLWLIHFWWPRLLQDPQFREVIKRRWETLRQSTLSDAAIQTIITQNVTYLTQNGAVTRNFSRWQVLGEKLPFNTYVGQSYTDEVKYTQDWLSKRTAWMDKKISEW